MTTTDPYVRTHEQALADGAACLEHALAYLRLGWSVLCLCPPDHVGVGKAHGAGCSHWGKRPVGDGGRWKERQTTAATEAEVRSWWRVQPNANVGMALGPVSGVVRVDIEGEAAMARFREISGDDQPATPSFTSGKGWGLLYGLPEGVEARTGVEGLADGELRVQGLGAQTVLPPSRHRTGRLYAWLPGRAPWECAVAPAPGWLLDKLRKGGTEAAETNVSEGEPIPEGRRDDTLTSMAGVMRRRGFGEAAILNALAAENLERCDPPLDDSQVAKIARSVARYEADAYADVTILRPSANGSAPPQVKVIDAGDVATIDDLIRAGAEVRWLWEGWIPLGVLTAIAAPGGTGKTRFCADLLRRIRCRHCWPDGRPMTARPDSLALWVVADNHHDEMVTLSQAFGIKDGVRVNANRDDPYGGVTLETADDYAALEARVKAVRPALVVIDTVGNATDKNLSKQEDAKAFYWPLQVLARKYACAVLCLTHLNAGGHFLGRRVLEKVRVALRMEQCDPKSEKRRLEVFKTNSKKPPALGLLMGDRGNEYDDNPPERSDGEEPGTPRTRGKMSHEIKAAMEWLKDTLSGGPRRVSNTRDEANAAGIPVGTLYNAMRTLKVYEYDSEGYKWWRLTEKDT